MSRFRGRDASLYALSCRRRKKRGRQGHGGRRPVNKFTYAQEDGRKRKQSRYSVYFQVSPFSCGLFRYARHDKSAVCGVSAYIDKERAYYSAIPV